MGQQLPQRQPLGELAQLPGVARPGWDEYLKEHHFQVSFTSAAAETEQLCQKRCCRVTGVVSSCEGSRFWLMRPEIMNGRSTTPEVPGGDSTLRRASSVDTGGPNV